MKDSLHLKRPRAILFDMDGTLTVPMLDFPQIKRDMGIPIDQPILEMMSKMNDRDRRAADAVLLRHEDHAADHSQLNAGCEELLDWLATENIATAIVTRNSLRSAERVMRSHQLQFAVLITRDDGLFKPSPKPLQLACERLGVSSEQAWMVGDGHHDIEAANAAQMTSVWISHRAKRPFEAEPTHEVNSLVELHERLRNC